MIISLSLTSRLVLWRTGEWLITGNERIKSLLLITPDIFKYHQHVCMYKLLLSITLVIQTNVLNTKVILPISMNFGIKVDLTLAIHAKIYYKS